MGRRQGGVRGGARARGVRQALFGLGVTLWWLGETEASLRHRERAYAVFRRRPDHEQAVLAAFYLCLAYRMSLGDHAASRGWLGRAAGLVEELALGPLNGWVLVGRASLATDGGHPQAGERHARQAREIARESGDADLELCAMSELGAALVELGRIEEGTALLDEAMAGALAGEGRGLDTVVLIACRTITSCSRGGDLHEPPVGARGRRVPPALWLAPPVHHLSHAVRRHPARHRPVGAGRGGTPGRAADRPGGRAGAPLRGARGKLSELRLAQGRPADAPATRARRARRDAGMRQEHGEMSEKRTEAVGGHAVVIGASMAGLLAARGSPTPTSG